MCLIDWLTVPSDMQLIRQGDDGNHAWTKELSGREKQILGLSAAGLVDKNIATDLDISVNTLRTYWARIRRKSGNLPRAALTAEFVRRQFTVREAELSTPDLKPLLSDTADPEKLRRTAIYYATAFQRIEESLRRVYHASKVLAAYPRQGFRASDESELFKLVCKILVDEGGYVIAWVALPVDDEGKSVRIAEAYSHQPLNFNDFQMSWGENPLGRGAVGTAFRTGKTKVIKDFLGDPTTAPWRNTAIKYGFQSAAALPLLNGSETIAVICAYAHEPDAFDENELSLLELVANDFAISLLELQKTAKT
jgi:DNA-binding CsgD family transcriptional regulator